MKHDRLDAAAAAGMLGLCALWGFSHIAVKVANSGISPAFQSGLRSAGALAVLLVWTSLRGIPMFARDGTLLVGNDRGCVVRREFALIYWALVFTDVARGIIFIYTTPFFVALGRTFSCERAHGPHAGAGTSVRVCRNLVAFWDGLTLPSARALIGDAMMVRPRCCGARPRCWSRLRARAHRAGQDVGLSAGRFGGDAHDRRLARRRSGHLRPRPLVLGSLAFQILIVASFSYLAGSR